MSNDAFEDEVTVEIPLETMLEARARALPARVSWGCPILGSDEEVTAVSGIPLAIDPECEDTEPMHPLWVSP
jgi:hypothetical protein